MRPEAVILEDFRAYQRRIRVESGDLVAFIGKDDVGKSSVLPRLRFSVAGRRGLPILAKARRLGAAS